jgi:hypothetical protein
MLKKLTAAIMVAAVSALMVAVNAFAAADPTVTDAKTQVTTYFTDNLPTIIGGFIAVAMALWGLRLLFHSTGVKKANGVA